MVDLPACKTVMSAKKTKRKWIDGEDFYVARRRAGLTPGQAADMLQVTTRTMRNWENGSSRIPYAAFRLMRLSAGHVLVGKAWEGWTIYQGVLYSPAGRGFEPYQLTYLGNYLWMARQWLKDRMAASAAKTKTKTFSATELEALASDEASGATAPSGSRLHHKLRSSGATVSSLHIKTNAWAHLEISPKFRHIAEPANDVIHSEVR